MCRVVYNWGCVRFLCPVVYNNIGGVYVLCAQLFTIGGVYVCICPVFYDSTRHLEETNPRPVRGRSSTSESNILSQFSTPLAPAKSHNRTLYNAAMILAAVGAGFDIRAANSSAVHPRIDRASATSTVDDDNFGDDLCSTAGSTDAVVLNHTYHGMTSHFRASLDLDGIPTTTALQRDVARQHTYRSADSVASMTPSCDDGDTNDVGDNFSGITMSVLDVSSSAYKSSSANDLCGHGELTPRLRNEVIVSTAAVSASESAVISPPSNVGRTSDSPIIHPPPSPTTMHLLTTLPTNSSSIENEQTARNSYASACLNLVEIEAAFLTLPTAGGFSETKQTAISPPPRISPPRDSYVAARLNPVEIVAARRPADVPMRRPDTLNLDPAGGETKTKYTSIVHVAFNYEISQTLSKTSVVMINGEDSRASPTQPVSSGFGSHTLRSVTSPGCTPPHIDHPRTLLYMSHAV